MKKAHGAHTKRENDGFGQALEWIKIGLLSVGAILGYFGVPGEKEGTEFVATLIGAYLSARK